MRVSYGTRQMTGTSEGATVELHPRCRKMYELLGSSAGRNDLERLQQYFTHPEYEICAGKATIDMMVFDTTARVAYLSRGPGYRVAWRDSASADRASIRHPLCGTNPPSLVSDCV